MTSFTCGVVVGLAAAALWRRFCRWVAAGEQPRFYGRDGYKS